MSVKEQLAQGIDRLDIELPQDSLERLVSYVSLLGKWNRVYNLTAIREPGKVVTHHVLDSLAVLPHINADTIADIGSGAGLPGIPIALARPLCRIALVESNHKKCAFLRQAMTELRLSNVDVVTERAEKWHPPALFDLVISRAFADLAGFVEVAGHLCKGDGALAAMKGLYPDEELAQLPSQVQLQGVGKIDVPGLRAARHLVIMRPGTGTKSP
jgi:16S rRNA (guanine527-N7)-methyltransferase